ncbi:hypothetical protein HF325_005324 [Metschnikowia pulcherrima]|uniref:Integrase catalytic domain-containing protein n=1 Tax=Metschnikowia pulcherrima TaxID=27326 RepID=A0A8H7GMU0_9ASCO|nr:hypothetical protein HF325_005324 [Metschnikowia pulcherrima]
MREGLEGPVPEGFSKAERANYRRDRRNALHDFSLGEEDGKLYRKSQHGSLKVVPFNKVIDVIHEHHASLAHSGVNKTFAYLKDQYYGVTFADLNFLLERCTFCESTRRRPNRPRAPLEAKESSHASEPEESSHASESEKASRKSELTQVSRPLERVQIDVVDVRSDPSEEHQWTLHVKDLFTKLSMLYALQDKQSQEIAMHLRQFMRFYGPPESIQLYDCKEFRGDVEKLLESRGVKIIYVSSKALKLQGLVKQANWVVKRRMVMWKKQNPESDWKRGLESIERSINNSSCLGLPPRLTPHKLLLGQNRRIELESERLTMNLSMLEIDKIAMGI